MLLQHNIGKYRAFWGFVALLGSAALGAAGLALIASHQWPVLAPEAATRFLLIVQWQLAGVLIAKGGLDQLVFAQTSKNPSLTFDVGTSILRFTIPTAFIYSVFLTVVFSPQIAIACFLCILFDVGSILGAADANARRQHTRAALGTLLNYPPFFLLLWVWSTVRPLDEVDALWLFCLTSVARFLCFYISSPGFFSLGSGPYTKPSRSLAIQPLLNYLAFRMDHLVVTGLFIWAPHSLHSGFLSQYVFLAKFPELVAGIFVQAGLVIFPRLKLESAFTTNRVIELTRRHWPWAAGTLVAVTVAAAIYVQLYLLEQLPFAMVIPFAVHALLVFPTNLVSFGMFQVGRTHRLLTNLSIALLIGMAWVVTISAINSWSLLVWLVPLQLTAFVALGLMHSPSERALDKA
jgi:hypothetical protein